MADHDTTTITLLVRDGTPPDLSLLDTLARAQLRARTTGSNVRVRTTDPTVVALLDLIGLGGIVPVELIEPHRPTNAAGPVRRGSPKAPQGSVEST